MSYVFVFVSASGVLKKINKLQKNHAYYTNTKQNVYAQYDFVIIERFM